MTDREMAQTEVREMQAALEEMRLKLPTLRGVANSTLLSLAETCIRQAGNLPADVATYDLEIAYDLMMEASDDYNTALTDIADKERAIQDLEHDLEDDKLWGAK